MAMKSLQHPDVIQLVIKGILFSKSAPESDLRKVEPEIEPLLRIAA